MTVTVETPTLTGPQFTALETEWRSLEVRASCSFFQSWSWIGCRVAERFDSPLLIRAIAGEQTIGLALFNRRRRRLGRYALWTHSLWLHQTGDPAEDSVFIEHNGPLIADGHPAAGRAILREALRCGSPVMLGGVGDAVLSDVRGLGIATILSRSEAPYANLAARTDAPWLARRGGATRSQLQRSKRRLEALGTLSLDRATTAAEADEFLRGLAVLHQAAWTRRGKRGAFAEPAFARFHAALIQRCLPRGEVALWRLSVGSHVVGYLYNCCWRGAILAYQSGFDTAVAPRASPGLTLHALVILDAAERSSQTYDFLAGQSRYKRELSDAATPLYWIELVSRLSWQHWRRMGLQAAVAFLNLLRACWKP